MKNSYSKQLQMQKQMYRAGCNDGVHLMSAVFLIALDNVAKEMFEDSVVSDLLRNTETEAQRVYNEVMDSVPRHEESDMAEILAYYTEEIRKRRGMDEN